MTWLAVRSVYLCFQKPDGVNVFEERVVCFVADSDNEAWKKAEAESERYAAANHFRALPEREAYLQDGDTLIDGYEVWSVMLESKQSLEDFYASRYAAYDYHPE